MNIDCADSTLWGIHAGKTGDADTLFLKSNVVALGWEAMPDLSSFDKSRESFKQKLESVLPGRKPGYYPIAAGQMSRFVHELSVGDIVIYPSKREKRIYIGQVKGQYKYAKKASDSYPHQRAIKWLKSFPRRDFSQGALYEIGNDLVQALKEALYGLSKVSVKS